MPLCKQLQNIAGKILQKGIFLYTGACVNEFSAQLYRMM